MEDATHTQGRRMTPRERVLTALRHQQPDRVPFSWGFGPTAELWEQLVAYSAERCLDWAKLFRAVEDVDYANPAYIGPPPVEGKDLWGIGYEAHSYGTGAYSEFSHYPLAGMTSVAEVEAYPWPDPEAYDFGGLHDQILAADPDRTRAKKTTGFNPFEIYSWMTGLEETLINLVAQPELVEAALGRITGVMGARLNRTLEACGELIDIVMLADDLGGQQGLLVSRVRYRRQIQPFHRELADSAHRLAPHAKVMFHSDGAVFEVLPDLIEAGIDLLEAVQTDAAGMDPVALKTTYGDRLSFHGGIAVQSLLPYGDEKTVFDECRRLVEVFGAGGGYIAAPTHAIQIGTPPANVLTMLRAVLGEADYETALKLARA